MALYQFLCIVSFLLSITTAKRYNLPAHRFLSSEKIKHNPWFDPELPVPVFSHELQQVSKLNTQHLGKTSSLRNLKAAEIFPLFPGIEIYAD